MRVKGVSRVNNRVDDDTNFVEDQKKVDELNVWTVKRIERLDGEESGGKERRREISW
jgi:hypothetical protein